MWVFDFGKIFLCAAPKMVGRIPHAANTKTCHYF